MITALLVIFTAAFSFALGLLVATVRMKRIMDKDTADFLEAQGFVNTEKWAQETFANTIAYECPEGHAGVDELCNTSSNGVWVCLERIKYAEEMEAPLYDAVLSHNESPDEPGLWREVEIQNDCGYGCKIYEHQRTGRRILWHNSAYGCRQ